MNTKSKNILFLYLGYFFVQASVILMSNLLPFYLKQKGLSIVQIGLLLTISVAIGVLIFSLFFGKILKNIKLKLGLYIASGLSFLYSFIFFIIPTSLGVVFSKFTGEFEKNIFRTSSDVVSQHNINKNHLRVSSILSIVDSMAIVFGLVLAVILLKFIDYRWALLVFSLVSIPSIFFFSKIKEKEKIPGKFKLALPKISNRLKILFLSEMLYWLGLGASFSLVITFLVTDFFKGSVNYLALVFVVLYVSITITTFLAEKIVLKMNLIKSAIFGMIILLLSAVIVIVSKSFYVLIIAVVLEGIGAGIWVPSRQAFYWKNTHHKLREEISGIYSGMRNFTSAIGPLVGSLLVVSFGIKSPFYFKAILALASIVIYLFLLKGLSDSGGKKLK
jgi:predicted MFS family arabinose efflux permease